MELETERRRLADASKSHRKTVRGEKEGGREGFPGIQEYKLRAGEGRKAGERLANLVDKLQLQVVQI